MKNGLHLRTQDVIWLGAFLLQILLFWVILMIKLPTSFTRHFHEYSLGLFLVVLVVYYLSFRFENFSAFTTLGITISLFALTLSYMWTSGYSDNKVIAGFLPYKDGAGYYLGAGLILNGLPLENSAQAGLRPLFSGFLSSMLLVLRGNLMWVLAFLVLLVAIGIYCATRQVLISYGILPASLFITLLYFYIQPLIGLTMTELLGFSLGCFAFSLLWRTSYSPQLFDVALGLFALTLALSVRAGTFFMLPLLVLWAGRMFRGTAKISVKISALSIIIIFFSYYIFNSVYPRFVGVPAGTVFGNFAYSLYGQVQGGTGWHRAIEELGTVNAKVIYRAAFEFFLSHPQSLLIGIAKAYRDFFLPGDGSMFVFELNKRLGWLNLVAWAMLMVLIVKGVVISMKNMTSNTSLMLLASFVGIVLSIPFLPPIDGGSRFYASTAPFFFAMPVMALNWAVPISESSLKRKLFLSEEALLRITLVSLSILTVLVPWLVQKLSVRPAFTVPSCSIGQVPFVMKYYPNSYVDLISTNKACGFAPEICLVDFEKNSTERTVDDFYQKLDTLASNASVDVRIIPAINFVDKKFHYFDFYLQDIYPYNPFGLISGCAIEHPTKNQSVYQVISILSGEK